MADYKVSFTRSARKELSRLDKKTVSRIFVKIEALANEPFPSGCRKIQGATDLWRIRVGSYRVIYQIIEQELVIEIVSVRHRRDAYRY
jgi:mRNA interferase RelE/StbE